MEFFQTLDASIFHFINGTLANPVTDSFMPFITEGRHWTIFYVIMGLYLLIKGGVKGRTAVILAIVLIFMTDQGSNVIKEFFQRVRPCNTLSGVHLLVNCSGSFSFVSNHAANNLGEAYLLSRIYPHMAIPIYVIAGIVAISRVFCGVHYPGDVLGGAIYGTLCALLLLYIYSLIFKHRAVAQPI